MFFSLLVFVGYIVALVVTDRVDFGINIESLELSMKSEMESFVASKAPQSTADVEHWINEYMRKNQSLC